MICADFLAGANLDNSDPRMLLQSMTRFFKFLPGAERQEFLSRHARKHHESTSAQAPTHTVRSYKQLCHKLKIA